MRDHRPADERVVFASGSGTAYAPDPGFVGHDTFNCDGDTIEVDVLLPEDG